jgi:hypothetical protein
MESDIWTLEIWKPIEGFEGLYEISNWGRVKSLHQGKEMILISCLNEHGYPRISLNKNSIRKTFLVHRLVALHFIPNPEEKKEVNHIDCNKQNPHVSNLEWTTQSENQKHAYANNCHEKTIKKLLKNNQNPEFRIKKREACIRSCSKIVTWYHEIYGEITTYSSELLRMFPYLNLNQGALSAVSLGKRPHHKGWRVKSE